MNASTPTVARDARDFLPAILALQESPPSPLPRAMLYLLLTLFALLSVWAVCGKLDIIAVAEGKLVPKTYLKIVQPAEGGILKEILVNEGDHVAAGQVLMRMDRQLADADTRILDNAIAQRTLQLRRIDAELTDSPFDVSPDTPSLLPGEGRAEGDEVSLSAALIDQVRAQYHARRQSYRDALAEEQAALAKAKEDLAAAQQVRQKLAALLPSYQQEEAALTRLGERHLAAELEVVERRRKRIETEQDLRAQERAIESQRASIAQSETRLAQITSRYREQLQGERIEAQGDLDKLRQERAKQQHRNTLLELKAPQDGIVKDLATHTLGAVVGPGTVLLTLVPAGEGLHAEVMIRNEDIGFVHEGQRAKLKLAAYPFQKYGLVEGTVLHVSADASDVPSRGDGEPHHEEDAPSAALAYKAIVQLDAQSIQNEHALLDLAPGMQVVAEIDQGRRTVLEYLLSPVRKTVFEAGRER